MGIGERHWFEDEPGKIILFSSYLFESAGVRLFLWLDKTNQIVSSLRPGKIILFQWNFVLCLTGVYNILANHKIQYPLPNLKISLN